MDRREDVSVDRKEVENEMVREGICVKIDRGEVNRKAEAKKEVEVYETERSLTAKKRKNTEKKKDKGNKKRIRL